MLNASEIPEFDRPAATALGAWINRALNQVDVRAQLKVRGNQLYILCEGALCPDQGPIVDCLRTQLTYAALQAQVPQLDIHRVTIYGRSLGAAQPQWATVLDFEPLTAAPTSTTRPETSVIASPTSQPSLKSSIQLTSQDLLRLRAKSGDLGAIAQLLSLQLSPTNVTVRVKLRPYLPTASPIPSIEPRTQRLWLICEAAYSPDPNELAEAIACQLRLLALPDVRDAMVMFQVRGEKIAEWVLRVDLTPAQDLLRVWASWGDPRAIARLLQQQLIPLKIAATIEGTTLHLQCTRSHLTAPPQAPDQLQTIAHLKPLLTQLALPNIRGASLYGWSIWPAPPAQSQADWVHWVTLAQNADSIEAQVQRSSLVAITHWLTPKLNPDLDRQLATGGVKLQVRTREFLLHIMADGPSCPPQKFVMNTLKQAFADVAIDGITGICVYGRQAGQTKPSWKSSLSFVAQPRLVPAVSPEFAASDAYVGDLLAPPGALVWLPGAKQASWQERLLAWRDRVSGVLLHLPGLSPVRSGQTLNASRTAQQPIEGRVAWVWGMLGVCVAVSADWGLGLALKNNLIPGQDRATLAQSLDFSKLSLKKNRSDATAFNASGFVQNDKTTIARHHNGANQVNLSDKTLLAAAIQPRATIDPQWLPTIGFNSEQFDERWGLYRTMVAKSGVPDVLVLGSSRALRGIDPSALQEALGQQGYANVKVFNFGINGATAQMVDLVVRRLIPPNQLPKLVIWADGARAFNSGRPDNTFTGIATSPGYRSLPKFAKPQADQAMASSDPSDDDATPLNPNPLQDRYKNMEKALGQVLGQFSTVYRDRAQLRSILRQTVNPVLPMDPTVETIPKDGKGLIDINGFLPLSNRFNPVTYYQKFSRVPGTHDSDYDSFALQGRQDKALTNLAKYVKARGTALVFVNLPLTDEYLDVARRTYEEQFQQYMVTQSSRLGFTYRSLSGLWKRDHDFFSDPSHLNRYGAYAVSQYLAKDALMPWRTREAVVNRTSDGLPVNQMADGNVPWFAR